MSLSWIQRMILLLAPAVATGSFDQTASRLSPVKALEVPGGLSTILQTKGAFRALANPIPGFATPAKPVPSSTGCVGAAQDAMVTITALVNSNKIDHKGDYRSRRASHSYVLARIDVTDCNFEEYDIPAGHRAYWVVEPDEKQLLLRSHIIDVGLTAEQNNPEPSIPDPETEVARSQHLSFSECPQRHALGYDGALVAFRADVCTLHDSLSQTALNRLGATVDLSAPVKRDTIRVHGHIIATVLRGAFKRTRGPAYAPSDPLLWIVCSDGCCYADNLR